MAPERSPRLSYHLIETHLGITESGLAPGCGRNRSKPGASHLPSLNLQPMCGRYALTRTELLEEFFEFSFTGNQILPRFNVAPTTQIPVIRLREDWATRVDRSAMGGWFLPGPGLEINCRS